MKIPVIRDLGDIFVSHSVARLNSLGFVSWRRWRESHSVDPVGVGLQGGHTLTERVPDLDGLVSGGRHNLSRVGGNGNRQNVSLVSNKSNDRFAGIELPKSQGLVPGGRDGVQSVWRDGTVLDNVRVALQSLLGNTVVVLVSSQLPGDQGLVSGGGKEQIWVSWRGSKGGHPSVVAVQGSSEH
ncbi:hypothetical protein OGATHE_002874 [Ogataea polymorpha]|uniref:Uncharacterized protein n=1 Tax=Ogataea polymorpha TaxID=460523 RepID=A0A9P8PDZ3_9ASCO|nr:hypothetical protein OGATHE_002874 [Ogataea polymorpha]